MLRVELFRDVFTDEPRTLVSGEGFEVTARRYPSGVESVTIANDRGHVEVLPFLGQIIWDAAFDGVSLRMKNMFSQPHPARLIEDTYGCFAFHSGLLAAGVPSPEDTHDLHGEFACAPMDRAWLEVGEDTLGISGSYEYVKGFGDHYLARPTVTLARGATMFGIEMDVTNLSAYQPMTLQYMCHMNYAYVDGGTMTENLPPEAFRLRETVPAHVHPTEEWLAFNDAIRRGEVDATVLEGAEHYDPEIVFMADDLPRYGQEMRFDLTSPQGTTFRTEFSSADFAVATRWLLWNPDQQVAAFVLPGTSRPEGRLAAEAAGTLIQLGPGQSRHFTVTTGIAKEA